MTKISFDIKITHDPIKNIWFINDIPLDEYDSKTLLMHKVKPDIKATEQDCNITFELTPEFVAMLKAKYYNN